MTEAATERVFANDIANAPGHLPLPIVELRIAMQETQFRHDNTIHPLAPRPGSPIEIYAVSGEGMSLASACVFFTRDASDPDLSSNRLPMTILATEWAPTVGFLTRWRAILPGHAAGTTVRYRIGGWRWNASPSDTSRPDVWAHDGQGFWFRHEGDRGITTFAYRVEVDAAALPEWVRDAVIYQIFLDRFHPGTADGAFAPVNDPQGIHGGTLRGVASSLSYLHELGVDCLWLSPLNVSPSYHRYDSTDYFAIDPVLGTNEDLRHLVDEAHARGMRVLLDFVPAHVSALHPAFQSAQHDKSSSTHAWFTFEEWPDKYRCFLDAFPSLASINADDPGARSHLIENAVYWLREFGIDGFRIDHAIGASMDFWVALRTAMRETRVDSFTVGEATDTPDSLRRYRGHLDAVMDFPLANALRHTFGIGDWSTSRFDAFLSGHERYMSDGPGRLSFLDNHDMNRFLFLAGDDAQRLKLAALC